MYTKFRYTPLKVPLSQWKRKILVWTSGLAFVSGLFLWLRLVYRICLLVWCSWRTLHDLFCLYFSSKAILKLSHEATLCDSKWIGMYLIICNPASIWIVFTGNITQEYVTRLMDYLKFVCYSADFNLSPVECPEYKRKSRELVKRTSRTYHLETGVNSIKRH